MLTTKIDSVKRTFSQDYVDSLLWDGNEEAEVVEKQFVRKNRWSLMFNLVFHDKTLDKFFSTEIQEPATEHQDGYQKFVLINHEGQVVCYEVKPVQKVVTVYESVNG